MRVISLQSVKSVNIHKVQIIWTTDWVEPGDKLIHLTAAPNPLVGPTAFVDHWLGGTL